MVRVAVQQLWGGCCRNRMKKLKEKMPIYVKKMIKEKDLMMEYDSLIDACVSQGRHGISFQELEDRHLGA
jgi:hypothetical protein